ncbi:MAG: GntR family transcriptional regulator [Aquihabitans sp.]
MLLRVDPALPMPVYEQIRSQVARLAASGQAVAGTRLPTIRQLASDLGLSKGTVERAYELLEADGVVESRGRAGTFLRDRSARGSSPVSDLADLRRAADAFAVVVRQLGIDEAIAQDELTRALDRLR